MSDWFARRRRKESPANSVTFRGGSTPSLLHPLDIIPAAACCCLAPLLLFSFPPSLSAKGLLPIYSNDEANLQRRRAKKELERERGELDDIKRLFFSLFYSASSFLSSCFSLDFPPLYIFHEQSHSSMFHETHR